MTGRVKGGDYWTNSTGSATFYDLSHNVTIDVIEGVEPLDKQFGAAEPLAVPSMLRQAMFGQPALANAAEQDSSHATTCFGTFAVLDGARIQDLPEILMASGLEHACLFQGDAAAQMSDVAPWIVRLEEDQRLTRQLFTRGKGPSAMWDRAPGIYLRSRAGVKDLRAHLRRFIRMRDEAGAWYYLRIYDPRVMRAFLRGSPRFGYQFLARPPSGYHLTVITCFDGRAEVASPARDIQPETGPVRLGSDEKAILRHLTFEARTEALLSALDRGGRIEVPVDPARKNVILAALHRIYGYGFQQRLQQERWGVWELFYGAEFERKDPVLSRICDTQDRTSGERFALFQRRLEELYP